MSDINIKVNVVSQAAQASLGGLAKQAKVAEKGFKGLNLSIKNGAGFLTTFAGNLAAIGVSKAIGALSRGFASLTSSIFEATQSLETATTQFEVLTGSAAQANKTVKELQEFTARTPFRFDSVAKAARSLIAFGFEVDSVQDKLQVLGDVSAASGSDIGELALIFGQVRAAGKLTGERLLQFQERTVQIGPALAETLGKPEAAIKDLVSAGKIGFADFEKAFNTLNKEGSSAFEGMTKRSKTLEGRISTLQDNFQIFSAEIGSRFAPALKAGASTLTTFIQEFGKSAALKEFLDGLANAIPTAIKIMSGTLIIGIRIFNAFRLAAGALTLVFFDIVSGALAAAEATLEFAQAAGKFLGFDTSGLDATRESIKNFKEASRSTANDIDADNDAIAASEEKLVQSIETGTEVIIKKYQDEKAFAESTAQATIDANDAKIKSDARAAKERLAVLQKERADKITFLEEGKVIEDELKLAEEEARLLEDGKITEQEAIHLQELADQKATARENELLALKSQSASEAEILALRNKNELEQAKRSNAITQAKAKAEEKANADKIKQTANTFQALTTLSSLGNAGLFRIAKGFQTAQATIAGFTAIQNAASAAPFPANLPGIIIETARAATNVAAIRSQSPRFQQGGIVPGGQNSGDNVFARVNSGEMILNRSQQAQLFDIANGGGSDRPIEVTTVVQIGEEEVARAVSRQVAQGFDLGEGGV